MKYRIEKWPVIKFYKERENIEFPECQREPNIWTEEKKAKFIDSLMRGIPIPIIFLYAQGKGVYDCVDGNQRIHSIIQFFDGGLGFNEYETIDSVPDKVKSSIEESKITVVEIDEATDEELRRMFLRLQLGSPLNAGEKLNASSGEMKEFVFSTAEKHHFFKKINIPSRRFAKQQVFAQICINSFNLAIHGEYKSARYEKLQEFFDNYNRLDKYKNEKLNILETLDKLNEIFGESAEELTNRALVLSAYLFVEKLRKNDSEKDCKDFARFYIEFIHKMNEQAGKGLDYDKEYRRILDFYVNVTQAAFEPYSIERRQKLLEEFFDYYKSHEKILIEKKK